MFNDTLYQTRCVRLTYVLFNVMASHLILKRCEIILHYRFAQLHDVAHSGGSDVTLDMTRDITLGSVYTLRKMLC